LAWGAGTVASSSATRHLHPWYDDTIAETDEVGFRVPRAGTIRNLHLRHQTPAGNGGTITYTLLVNGVASSVTVGLASTGTNAADVANSVMVSAGDFVSIRVTKAASIAASPRNITATAELI